ncbi:hypothetical protein BCR42DRAFT_386353 [Absidia repens]|uniref:Uncharacterized protein n=1 Tax=Absidia repens TaxID=90262 RepID=A0A1X2J1P5_9FUNG|nr:hypothetical protein BCR42DRAFT_386353 [Absidia repens]
MKQYRDELALKIIEHIDDIGEIKIQNMKAYDDFYGDDSENTVQQQSQPVQPTSEKQTMLGVAQDSRGYNFIDYKAISKRHRKQMTKKKAHNNTIGTIENGMAAASSNMSLLYGNNKVIQTHKIVRNGSRMKTYGLNCVTKELTKKIKKDHDNEDVQMRYFYGDVGRGVNSRIKGHLRRGHSDLIKSNLRTVICMNPLCIGRKQGCIFRSGDGNAAMNMIISGLHQQCYGFPPPTFL